ncbi:MAG: carbohydrate kinase [Myxococcaceae bacterium]|nr:carbohydrate kinase [Myxococcaceae bacterium]
MTPLPELLVVGHVTRDFIRGETRLGGAASFSSRVAATLGIRTALVTAAPLDFDLMAPLRALPQLSIHVVPSPEATTFELDYSGPRRRVILRAVAQPIRAEDVPPEWRNIPVAYVAPVAGECDRALVEGLGSRLICAGVQGWLRRPGADGAVEPTIASEASSPPRGLRVGVFSEEDHPEAEFLAEQLARHDITVALTRGRRGSTVREGSQRWEIPSAPANEVDPTGAGDVFGIALTLALARGASAPAAAAAAAAVAARVVEGPELGSLSSADVRHLPPARTP